uniref:RING-type domain-containing protein n=1 Tax=Meloidogyne hapla TaxID=6305 RepID=A0A1I8BQK0_MELHA
MCSIFCNNLSVTDLYSLVCGHTFHIDCITPWINQVSCEIFVSAILKFKGGSCPRCRGVARLADLRRVYIEETANPVQEMTNETNSSNNKINVIVRDVYNDRKICIKDLDPKSTVAQLKHGVEQINGMPIEQQRIVRE